MSFRLLSFMVSFGGNPPSPARSRWWGCLWWLVSFWCCGL